MATRTATAMTGPHAAPGKREVEATARPVPALQHVSVS